ncbi:hypothetical protein K438DRAFT_2013390 [Mycena galopus ATCC 62051]|nr:hypothetical protein K438DRAFT_2013390 [Mycena galopus ATCC 62051]
MSRIVTVGDLSQRHRLSSDSTTLHRPHGSLFRPRRCCLSESRFGSVLRVAAAQLRIRCIFLVSLSTIWADFSIYHVAYVGAHTPSASDVALAAALVSPPLGTLSSMAQVRISFGDHIFSWGQKPSDRVHLWQDDLTLPLKILDASPLRWAPLLTALPAALPQPATSPVSGP